MILFFISFKRKKSTVEFYLDVFISSKSEKIAKPKSVFFFFENTRKKKKTSLSKKISLKKN
jgi:hypothetical protein